MSMSNRRSGYQTDHCAEKDLESLPRLFKGVLLCVGLGFKGFGSWGQRWVCSVLASCYSLLKWKRYLWPHSLQQLGARAHESVIPFPALFCLRRNGKAYLLLLGGIPHFPAGNDDSHHSGSSHPLVRHQWDHRKQQRQAYGALLDVLPRPVGYFLMGGRRQDLKWCLSASSCLWAAWDVISHCTSYVFCKDSSFNHFYLCPQIAR